MIDGPAGWVEYRKKFPYLESFQWDRCDYLQHGEKIPKEFTDIDKPPGSDVNAGLMVIEPNQKEYDDMISQLVKPTKEWLGKNHFHKGFYTFDFDNPQGIQFVDSSYCYPEQNYLTKRYSGKWNYIEFAFQSWALDPCNSFGIHMAAFNPKPWFKQPAKGMLITDEDVIGPYVTKGRKKSDLAIASAAREGDNKIYENISFCYEIFNDLIVWGLLSYPELHTFFMLHTEIYGKKISFDKDMFENIDGDTKSVKIKDIERNSPIYEKLSLSQKNIVDLVNDYSNSKKEFDKHKPRYVKRN